MLALLWKRPSSKQGPLNLSLNKGIGVAVADRERKGAVQDERFESIRCTVYARPAVTNAASNALGHVPNDGD